MRFRLLVGGERKVWPFIWDITAPRAEQDEVSPEAEETPSRIVLWRGGLWHPYPNGIDSRAMNQTLIRPANVEKIYDLTTRPKSLDGAEMNCMSPSRYVLWAVTEIATDKCCSTDRVMCVKRKPFARR